MSRFLSNLLARSLAPAPAIRPRLASRFEPAAGSSRPSPEPVPSLSELHEESSGLPHAATPAARPPRTHPPPPGAPRSHAPPPPPA